MLARVDLPSRLASAHLRALMRCLHHCCPRHRRWPCKTGWQQLGNWSSSSVALFCCAQRWMFQALSSVRLLAPVYCAGCVWAESSSPGPACEQAPHHRRCSSAKMPNGRINWAAVSEGTPAAGSNSVPLHVAQLWRSSRGRVPAQWPSASKTSAG